MNRSAADTIEDLILAMLAVQNWTLERVFASRDGLKRERIFDPAWLAEAEQAEVFDALRRGGYDRDDLIVGLVADRLRNAARAMDAEWTASLLAAVEANDRSALETLLLPLKGVGQHVLRHFCVLVEVE